jgi:ABC-type glycerol-3-phosphate transport system permease component
MRTPNALRRANARPGRGRRAATVARPRSWSRFAGLAVLWVGGLIMVIPFIWMVISSFKSAAEILSLPPTFFPKDPTLQNYREILTKHSFGRYLINSIVVTTASAASIVITSAVLGFAFAKIKFVGRDVIFAILSFIYNWDQLFWPLVLITSDQNKTVPLGIVDLSTQFGPIYDLTMAASTLTVVPILVVFFIFRRRFVEGMMMQGLKG